MKRLKVRDEKVVMELGYGKVFEKCTGTRKKVLLVYDKDS